MEGFKESQVDRDSLPWVVRRLLILTV